MLNCFLLWRQLFIRVRRIKTGSGFMQTGFPGPWVFHFYKILQSFIMSCRDLQDRGIISNRPRQVPEQACLHSAATFPGRIRTDGNFLKHWHPYSPVIYLIRIQSIFFSLNWKNFTDDVISIDVKFQLTGDKRAGLIKKRKIPVQSAPD